MKISLQGLNNAKTASALETITGGTVINNEILKGEIDGHRFNVGQRCKLVELEDYPEFNGEIVEVTSIRKDGPHGKAYYFKAANSMIAEQLNWTYEYRLEKI